jgi:hypothetical protein
VWYPSHWELWVAKDEKTSQSENNKFMMVDSAPHPVGRVPIATLWCGKLNEATSMAIESPLSDHLDLNRSLLNDASEANESERSQTFAVLAVPTRDGETIGALEISHWAAMSYNSDAGAPSYVSPNPDLPQGKMDRINKKIDLSRQLAAVTRGKAELSKEERSAAAIMLESEDKRNQLTMWAQSLEEYNRDVHEIMAAWEEVDDIPKSVYHMDFDTRAVSIVINDAVQLASLPVVSKNADVQTALARPIVKRIMTDAGEDREAIDAAVNALESEEIEPTPPPVIAGDDSGRGRTDAVDVSA